jgi:prepilin-type N-terminal cleavage/methylation domain-containing protein
MKRVKRQSGLTLLELLTAMAIIVIMVSMVLVATQVSWVDTNKKLTESTIALLDSALEDYREYNPYNPSSTLSFPNPNALSAVGFSSTEALHSASLYSGLNLVPDAKKILERIADSQIDVGDNDYPKFTDAWKTPLDYRYDPNMNFPLIISAGPDKDFNTPNDNITNRK